jgi:hypothetical protein
MAKETVESFINQETEYFFHQITARHYVDVSMYENFIHQLSTTGDIYTVMIERYAPTTYQEETVPFLDYENVLEQLKLSPKVTFESEDYLVISISKTSNSLYDQLTNLFLPMFPESKNVTMGGSMQ